MTKNIIKNNNKRRIWLAALLSLFTPGLGQAYCGRLKRGLLLCGLNILPATLIIGISYLTTAPVLVTIAAPLMCVSIIVQLIAFFDSALLAKRAGANYQLKDYNNLLVYILLIFIGNAGGLGSSFYMREQTLEGLIVPTVSGYPNILPDDRIFANKSAYRSEDPKRGDLVVFMSPENRKLNFVQRVIAIAGDTVEIKDSQLYINDKKLQQQKLPQTALDNIRIEYMIFRHMREPLNGEVFEEVNGDTKYNIFLNGSPRYKMLHNFEKITVPEHHCFVMGDARNMSFDSRNFGPILLATIKGRVDYLYLPAKDWSRFGTIDN